ATQEKRLFPVPIPMLPDRKNHSRTVDVVIAADFYALSEKSEQLIVAEINKNEQLGLKTGLVQMSRYNLEEKKRFNKKIRQMLTEKENLQMVVYGEEIVCQILIVHNPNVLTDKQKYIPSIKTSVALIIIEETPIMSYN